MNKAILKKIVVIMLTVAVLGIVPGCRQKTPETSSHIETGALIDIVEQISDECIANKDTQGAHDAWDTFLYLRAFCCVPWVNYDDVKNRNYENFDYYTGELLLSLAAYNESNEESAMDVEAEWISQYNSLTQEQLEAMDAYVAWYETSIAYDTREEYADRFNRAYDELRRAYGFTKAPAYDRLNPAQFREVQKYMEDQNYQIDASLWGM